MDCQTDVSFIGYNPLSLLKLRGFLFLITKFLVIPMLNRGI